MIVKGVKETFTFLFIEETTEYMRKWVGEKMSKEEASEISGIPSSKIYFHSEFEQLFRSLMTYARGIGVKPPKKLYLDLYRINPNEPAFAMTQFEGVLKTYPELKIKNANQYISYLRMFKSEDEIKALKEAIRITDIGSTRYAPQKGELRPELCNLLCLVSNPKRKKAPKINPIAAGITFSKPWPSDISIAGANKLQ